MDLIHYNLPSEQYYQELHWPAMPEELCEEIAEYYSRDGLQSIWEVNPNSVYFRQFELVQQNVIDWIKNNLNIPEDYVIRVERLTRKFGPSIDIYRNTSFKMLVTKNSPTVQWPSDFAFESIKTATLDDLRVWCSLGTPYKERPLVAKEKLVCNSGVWYHLRQNLSYSINLEEVGSSNYIFLSIHKPEKNDGGSNEVCLQHRGREKRMILKLIDLLPEEEAASMRRKYFWKWKHSANFIDLVNLKKVSQSDV
jgi:hypothetical protein